MARKIIEEAYTYEPKPKDTGEAKVVDILGELHSFRPEISTSETGAMREATGDRMRPDLISPFFLERLGKQMALGAIKYDDRNWEKGEKMSRLFESFFRHLVKWYKGETKEDHLAAMAANLMMMTHFDTLTEKKVLDMNDMPRYDNPVIEEK
jgi:hypothetical protein